MAEVNAMPFWKDIFGGRSVKSTPTPPPVAPAKLRPPQVTKQPATSPRTVQVPNQYREGDGRPLMLSESPDLDRIFSDGSPASPLMDSEANRRYWDSLDISGKRASLAIAFLQHPKSSVRLAAINLVRDIRTVGVSDMLINLLGDSDPAVSRAAAVSIWERQKNDNCTATVKALRDEIRGTTAMGTTDGLVMGRKAGIRALDLLIDSAPDERARAAINDIASREVVIEERIRQVDTSSVQYTKTEDRRGYTYEIYKAPNREQALAFLKSKVVTQPLYYIEVETPEGTFGRDLNGIYW
jgi:hypothetical protein